MFVNPQILHITIEVVILFAVVFWIYSRERQTNVRLKVLLQKIDEQENRILSLEAALNGLTSKRTSFPSFVVMTEAAKKEEFDLPLVEEVVEQVSSKEPPTPSLTEDVAGDQIDQEIEDGHNAKPETN